MARHDPALLQEALAIQGSPVLVTFGLLSPGKGIEYVLDALTAVASRHPRAVCLAVGATHPVVKREPYREELIRKIKRLGIWEQVGWQYCGLFCEETECTKVVRLAVDREMKPLP